MSEEIENRESRGEQKPSDVVVFSPEVLAMADRRRRQKAEELETCRQAAEDGDSQAQVQMGLHYIYGTHGVERDGKKAFEWFSQTASDDPVGRYWLGVCYDNGTGVERDGDRAFELFKESADMGYAPAQCDLGVCYETGQGTEPDLDMAIELYKQSAEQDYPMAKCNLGALYYFAAGVERDYDKAARYFTEAAEQRLPRAQQHPVIPLLNQPRAAQGVKQQVTLLVRAGGRKMPLRQILPRLGAYIRLPHRGRARRRPQPDTFRQDIHRVGQHVHPPHALLSILYTKFRLISTGSAFFAK